MHRFFGLFATCILWLCMSPVVVNASAMPFGPTPYLQTGDTPTDFFCSLCADPLHIEDFENGTFDAFLTIFSGGILQPNSTSGSVIVSTDSVDGDDGSVDGDGTGGWSYFSGNTNMMTITFGSSVTSAGLVFTDGDSLSTNVKLEAFNGATSLGVIDAGDLADDFFNGTTGFGSQEDEDNFLGFLDLGGITSLKISIDAGSGIEIDHIQWQNVPEPASLGSAFMGVVGLVGLLRRRR